MKKITNKNFIQKIVIAILIVISFNFITPTVSSADFGGVLLGPVIDLIAGIGDAVMAALQYFMDGGDNIEFSTEGFLVQVDKFEADKYGMQPSNDVGASETIQADQLDHGWFGWGTYSIPIIKYSPEKIFANQVPGLDANFITPKEGITNVDGSVTPYTQEQKDRSIALQLQSTIASWYNALRNLVIVGLLSVLLYVGIRIVLSSASDKAKYKQMLMDWLVALCLLFFLHYIMSFTMTVVDMITNGIAGYTDINVTIQDSDVGNTEFKTNLTGLCRIQVQYADLGKRMVYLLFYIALVVYTFMFTWKYMKRAITMAFLTLMAPLVTLTYPIDKMGDGKSQAFNMWLKEYIFNALLQPFHLIIYSIFMGAGMDLVAKNPLYAILFLAFIVPAEKIMRKFFGFDKASTAGASFAGALGGAAAFNMAKNLITKGANAKGGHGGQGKVGSGGGNVRQKKQLTDPNAPNGSLKPFAAGAAAERASQEEKTGSANQNEDGIDYTRAAKAQELKEQGMSQEDIAAKLGETLPFDRNTGSRTSEDDKRGVFAWGRDAAKEKWDNSQLKQRINSSAPARLVRKVGAGVQSVHDWANQKGNNIRTKYNALPKPIRNSLSEAKRTIKGAARVGGHALVGGAKFAGRATAAGAIGAIGLGMGIAGDDLEDVFKYGAAGTALGWSASPAIAHNIVSGLSSAGSDVRTTYEVGAYGETEAALRQQAREFRSDKGNQDFFAEAYEEQHGTRPSVSQLNSTMKVASEYNNAGITDLKQINKGMKLEDELKRQMEQEGTPAEESTRSARDQAMTIMKIASSVEAKDLRNSGKVKDLQQSFVRELKKDGMEERAATAQADRIIDMVKKQKKVY